jgi:hypothetical protein
MLMSQIVFEKGISIRRAEGPEIGQWVFESAEDHATVHAADEVTQQCGVRPIVGKVPSALGDGRMFLFLTNGRTLQQDYCEFFNESSFAHDIMLWQHKRNLDYVLGASIYHCARLADIYAQICRAFVDTPMRKHSKSDRVGFVTIGHTADPEYVYYEVDALLTAVRRAYEALRAVLWHQWPGKGKRPPSFAKTYPNCDGLPEEIAECLNSAWLKSGKRLKQFRDCIQHYAPVSPVVPFAQMERLTAGIWAASFWLPDNPEARSAQQFEFRLKTDALTYGCQMVNEVLLVAKAVVEEVATAVGA